MTFQAVLRSYIVACSGGNVCNFADLVGVSSASLYNWLAGVTQPDLKVLIHLCNRLEEITGQEYQKIITSLVLSLPRN